MPEALSIVLLRLTRPKGHHQTPLPCLHERGILFNHFVREQLILNNNLVDSLREAGLVVPMKSQVGGAPSSLT